MKRELLTEFQSERKKRNAAILADIAKMHQQYPDASDWRIYGELSRRYNVSVMTIRNVVRK